MLILLTLLIAALPGSHAKDICEAYRNYSPLPDWYQQTCYGSGGKGRAQIGGAYSSFSGAFNLNPASIPTVQTPIGVEYIGSFGYGVSKNNFGLLKGFQRIGAAISTNSDDTFYSNSSTLASSTWNNSITGVTSTSDPILPTLSVGSAISLDSLLKTKELIPNLGALLRYSKTTGKLSPGAGLTLSSGWLTLGYSMIRDPENGTTPATTFHTYSAGVKLSRFQLEYLYLKSHADPLSTTYTYDGVAYTIVSNLVDPEPIQVLTLSTNVAGFLLSGAVRRYQDVLYQSVTQYHFAIQGQLSRYLAAGYLYNYIPGFHSLGAQVFF